MLKCHSELFKSSVKLADGLRLSTKEELKDVAQLLLLPIPSRVCILSCRSCSDLSGYMDSAVDTL